MKDGAHIDFETRSTTELKRSGVYRYVEDPNTDTWCFTWRITANGVRGPRQRWRPGYADPVELLEWIRKGGRVVAHNASFERTVWNYILRRKYGLSHWPELKIQQMSCTMARGAALALPDDLDTLGFILGLINQKDKEGHALMLKMMKPRRRNEDGTYLWWDAPEMVERLMAYCDQDVATEDEADEMLPELTAREREVWELDQQINDRGVHIDIAAVTRAVDVVLVAKRKADAKMRELTDGAVKKCTERDKIAAWLKARGLEFESLKKSNADELLLITKCADDVLASQVLELRKEATKTSTAKYDKMLECVCEDDRIRGLLAFCGARRTGRWAGRLVQPQNFPRVDPDADGSMVEHTAWCLSQPLPAGEIYELIEASGYPVLPALAKSLRAMICAGPGNKLYGADFSNVEGRINAWLAGEEWKLEAFEAYDLGYGPDLYKLAYSRSFGVPVESVGKGHQRQIGKVQELALGYQGGIGALLNMADTYNMKVHELAKPVHDASPAEQWDKVAAMYEGARDKYRLPEAVWTACKVVVMNWRAANSKIAAGWYEAQDAAVEAVAFPGTRVSCYAGRITYMCYDNWLYCQLPSGRTIVYANAHLRTEKRTMVKHNDRWIDLDDFPAVIGWSQFLPPTAQDLKALGFEVWERTRNVVWFVGQDSLTRQWREMYLYGGHQCENIVQATARCLMDRAMSRVESAGYPLVLTVHDELLSEVRQNFGSVAEYRGLMSQHEAWAQGLPVSAAAWEDQRYVK